jgi:hypothetical protein
MAAQRRIEPPLRDAFPLSVTSPSIMVVFGSKERNQVFTGAVHPV